VTPPPLHDPERESDAQFVIALLALLLGCLGLLAAGIVYFTDQPGIAAEGFPRFNIIAAIGAGLVALGLSLEYPRIVEFLNQRKSLHALNAVVMSVLAAFVLVLVNVMSNRYDFWRADLTSEGLYTLSEESRALVAGLDRDVRLVLLTALEAQQREIAPVEAILDQYDAASGRVEVKRVDLRRMTFTEREKQYKELDLQRRDRSEGELIGIVVQTGRATEEGWVPDKSKHIPLQEMWERSYVEPDARPTFNGELKISSAIREVLDETRAKLYFLTGHLEQSIDDPAEHEGLAKLAGLLRQRNLEVVSLNLLAEGKVPDDAALLVIAGPRTKLEQREVQAIERYLARGGDAIVMLEPVFDKRGGETRVLESGLEEVLRDEYGLEAPGQQLFFAYTTELRERKFIDDITCDGFDPAHKIAQPLKGFGRVAFKEARPAKTVPVKGATTTELVKTESITDLTIAVADPFKQRHTQAEILKGPFTLVSTSEREVGEGEARTRSRVVLAGDASWATNPFIEAHEVQNLELFIHAAFWAMDRDEKTVGKIARPKSYRLVMSPQRLAFLKLFSVLGLPAISICVGVFAWSVRRR
jgi:ABC-type uncharacterized transport system involved in gliding motility auxiliary subunit